MKKKQNGFIVVETLGTFIPFVILLICILSLINVVFVQTKIHYALTQTANTLSMYCYILESTGVANDLKMREEKKSNIRHFFSHIDDLGKSMDVNNVVGINFIEMFASPDYIKNIPLDSLLRNLVGDHLKSDSLSADDFLKRFNVVDGLNGLSFFKDSAEGFSGIDTVLIDKEGNVVIVVEYEISYNFGTLTLPFDPTFTIIQVVKTKALLSGSGEGYW